MTDNDKLTQVFQDLFEDPGLRIRDDMTAADVEGWDSLTHINLLVAIERVFKIKFTTAEVTGMKNVGDLRALIAKKEAR